MPKTTIGLAELPETPHFLYRLFDRTDTLLYIGITNDPKTRFKWHRKNQPWWCDVDQAKTKVDYYPSRDAVLKAEAEAIKEEQPLYNDQHNLTVDTPTRRAIDDALSEFAQTMLASMIGNPHDVNVAIKEGEVDLAELLSDGETPDTADPAVHAAAIVASRMLDALESYEQIVRRLISWLPDDIVWPAYSTASHDLRISPDKDDLDLTQAALDQIELVMSRRLLNALPADEARKLRNAAENYLLSRRQRGLGRVSDDALDLHAAAYARASRAQNPYLFAKYRCVGKGADSLPCMNLGVHRLVFNGCSKCSWEPGGCVGHGNWCQTHYDDFFRQGMLWVDGATIEEDDAEPSGNDEGQAA